MVPKILLFRPCLHRRDMRRRQGGLAGLVRILEKSFVLVSVVENDKNLLVNMMGSRGGVRLAVPGH